MSPGGVVLRDLLYADSECEIIPFGNELGITRE